MGRCRCKPSIRGPLSERGGPSPHRGRFEDNVGLELSERAEPLFLHDPQPFLDALLSKLEIGAVARSRRPFCGDSMRLRHPGIPLHKYSSRRVTRRGRKTVLLQDQICTRDEQFAGWFTEAFQVSQRNRIKEVISDLVYVFVDCGIQFFCKGADCVRL
jgi:hypothetical protein